MATVRNNKSYFRCWLGLGVGVILLCLWTMNFWAMQAISTMTRISTNKLLFVPSPPPQKPPPEQQQQRQEQRQGQQQRQEQQVVEPLRDEEGYEFHIVFSSGCNALQDWQSYAFFYQILASGFGGNVTRIASCESPEQAQALHKLHYSQVESTMTSRFRLHTTPDYSHLTAPKYNFFNKPFGIRHWMEHGLKLSHSQPSSFKDFEKTIIVIMDPDQFLIRTFRRDMTHEPELWMDPQGYRIVQHGQPMAALYAFGGTWIHSINVTDLLTIPTVPPRPLPNTKNNGSTSSGLLTWDISFAAMYLAIGPPYIAVTSDMFDIVTVWSDFVIPIHNQCQRHGGPDATFMAEMYAYSTAAAHLNLPHQVAKSFMISDPDAAKAEAWTEWIDNQYPLQQAKFPHIQNQTALLEITSKVVCSKQVYPRPHVYHFCQRFYLGPYFFSKYQVPKDAKKDSFLTCSHPLFQEAPDNVAALYDSAYSLDGEFHSLNPTERIRMAFALCQMLPRLNDAAAFYKKTACPGNPNFNKSFLFDTLKNAKKKPITRYT